MTMSRPTTDQSGSLPLVLLAAIVLAGIVVVLFGQVRTAQETSRRDRDFHQAIQVAEAGAQSAFTFIASQEPSSIATAVGGELTQADVGSAVDADLGEGAYEWRAFRLGSRSWQVRSLGTYRSVTRAVEIEFGPRQMFFTAIWGDASLGGNFPANTNAHTPSWHAAFGWNSGLGAYDSQTGLSVPLDEDSVVAGTTGSCSINPAPDDLDQILYTDGGDEGDLAGCDGRDEDIPDFPDVAQEAFDSDGLCDASGFKTDGTYSSYPNYFGVGAEASVELSASTAESYVNDDGETVYYYCFESMQWGKAHEMTVDGGPFEIYVRGALTVSGSGQPATRRVNVDDVPPRASDLRLLFAGEGATVNVADNNFSHVAAALYAPNRACIMDTQVVYYGAIICNQFSIQGGGGFHFFYDVSTADIFLNEEVGITNLDEEFLNTSGFTWVAGG